MSFQDPLDPETDPLAEIPTTPADNSTPPPETTETDAGTQGKSELDHECDRERSRKRLMQLNPNPTMASDQATDPSPAEQYCDELG